MASGDIDTFKGYTFTYTILSTPLGVLSFILVLNFVFIQKVNTAIEDVLNYSLAQPLSL